MGEVRAEVVVVVGLARSSCRRRGEAPKKLDVKGLGSPVLAPVQRLGCARASSTSNFQPRKLQHSTTYTMSSYVYRTARKTILNQDTNGQVYLLVVVSPRCTESELL